MSFFEEVNEFWVSANYSIKYFSKHNVKQFLTSLNDKNGLPPKGTNIMFRHVKLKHPVSKTYIANMSNEDMKFFLEMINVGY
ncbi:MAG: hypothetical protein QQN65_04015 [Nitrosopumilus sp.]